MKTMLWTFWLLWTNPSNYIERTIKLHRFKKLVATNIKICNHNYIFFTETTNECILNIWYIKLMNGLPLHISWEIRKYWENMQWNELIFVVTLCKQCGGHLMA